ncbi:hypothetical protein ACSQ67_008159 [Phaseolus vulgaris]
MLLLLTLVAFSKRRELLRPETRTRFRVRISERETAVARGIDGQFRALHAAFRNRPDLSLKTQVVLVQELCSCFR